MQVSATLTFSFPIEFKEEGKYIISHCPILDIWSQGKTEEKAKKNIAEAVLLFLIDCHQRNTLQKVLKDCGFVAVKKLPARKPQPPMHEITVPLPFVIDEHRARCHD